MKITKTEKVLQEVEVTVDIICNKCGKSCKMEHGFYGMVEATVTGGYESEHLGDLSKRTFSMCEGCLVALFETFEIKPELSYYDLCD